MPWISFPSHRPGTSSLVCWWHLREGVGPGAPPGQKQRQANRLEDLGRSADGNGVDGALLGENLVEVLGIVQLATSSNSFVSYAYPFRIFILF